MVGRELVARTSVDLRELGARVTLQNVRQKGHTYVELRPAGTGGKRTIFFCTLCLTQCFSDGVLFDHLGGSLHARKLAAAKATLFGPDPWPFSDGVLFFNPLCENGKSLFGTAAKGDEADEVTSRYRDDGYNCHGDSGADPLIGSNGHKETLKKSLKCDANPGQAVTAHSKMLKHKGIDACRTIHQILLKDQVMNVRVDLMGLGHVAARIQEGDKGRGKINRIWCAWLGQGDSDDSDGMLVLPKCDFSIVCFTYAYDLGRHWTLDDIGSPRSEGSYVIDEDGSPGKKRKKSFSDPEDSSQSVTIPSRHFQNSRFTSSRSYRRELRKRKRLAAEKTCDICAQQMIPGKDVGTLLNCKTGRLACSGRNTNGAFHLFHISCLVHWILLCEYEMMTDHLGNVKPTRGRKGKASKRISSVFCPECEGTGKHILGDELEKPTVPLAEVFLHKLKAIEAHNAWMKNPEDLQRCSTGLHFLSDSDENYQEKVMPGKLLRFYRAADA